jgi:flagellar basal-body rod protein FlgC
MIFNGSYSAADISASGLSAERQRMEIVANNIANAHSTRTPQGGPFRRQNVVFSAAYDEAAAGSRRSAQDLRGVRVVSVEADQSQLPRVYQPGHPDADADGYVTMPNVKLPNEMVDLITASRAYEANLRALSTFKSMVEQALTLLRGSA